MELYTIGAINKKVKNSDFWWIPFVVGLSILFEFLFPCEYIALMILKNKLMCVTKRTEQHMREKNKSKMKTSLDKNGRQIRYLLEQIPKRRIWLVP